MCCAGLPVAELNQSILVQPHEVSNLVNHGEFHLVFQLLLGPAHLLERLLKQEDGVRVQGRVGDGALGEGNAPKYPQQRLTGGNLHLIQQVLGGMGLHRDEDVPKVIADLGGDVAQGPLDDSVELLAADFHGSGHGPVATVGSAGRLPAGCRRQFRKGDGSGRFIFGGGSGADLMGAFYPAEDASARAKRAAGRPAGARLGFSAFQC